eukprot:TRINITY_DN5016_c0_g5_i1.p1 TRINITY_DN5016_c0_g5~~TRINITY_DN5016_c0_g5_i1.p1  ORF type:complete len:402 (+),score=28.35 TRINITY_DN5016_c0_g5_i1:151-1206(+)
MSSDHTCLEDIVSASGTSSDSSDSDADVDTILDASALQIKAPETERPARRRPWGSTCAPSLQSEEAQAKAGQPSSDADGQTHAAKVDTSKFVLAPESPASREHVRRLSVPADVSLQNPSSWQALMPRDSGSCSMPKRRPSRRGLDAHRFASSPSRLNSEARSKLPALTPNTSIQSRSCSKATSDVATKKGGTCAPQKASVCPPHGYRQRSCSVCLPYAERSSSSSSRPMYTRQSDARGSGMQYNIVQFSATPTLSTSCDPLKPPSTSRSKRNKQEGGDKAEKDKAAPKLLLRGQQNSQMLMDMFGGMSMREVREVLKDHYSSDEIASVLEVLSSRVQNSENQYSRRRRKSV